MSVRRRIDVLFVVLFTILITISAPAALAWGGDSGKALVVNASQGADQVYAIAEDNTLYAWGGQQSFWWNRQDELRFGGLGTGSFLEQNPTMAMVLANVKSVSASSTHALAVTQDGKLYGWGNAQFGNMGEQYYGDSANYWPDTPVLILDGVQAAAAGDTYSLVVMDNGDLWGYGGNEDGQLAVTPELLVEYPQGIKIMDHVVAVNAVANWGEQCSSFAIQADGSLWGWGSNYMGRLGDGSEEDRYSPVKIMEDVSMVSLGEYATYAVKDDGSLWGWGSGLYNCLLGVNTTSPTLLMEDVRAVSAGRYFALVIQKDDTLWAFGSAKNGLLGNGENAIYSQEAYPVQIMENVATIAAGDHNGFAVKQDGTLWGWGVNDDGQLMDSDYEMLKLQPAQISSGMLKNSRDRK